MNRVARRYTKALFELAQEQKILSKIDHDMQLIRKLIEESSDFQDFLSNPLIAEAQKQDILKEIFEKKVEQLTLNFLELLASKRRIAALPAIATQFRDMMLKYQNIVEGELISAVPLDREQSDLINKYLEKMIGKTIRLEQKIQPEIIGGFVVRVQDMVIDSSIRLQLNKLREKLTAR
ncbi:MAG: ATP synthase F1 subunit delta [Calditrichaeota bacterium]|nr:ATP synthase F1 subunit delta [Calditrichota bacterium]